MNNDSLHIVIIGLSFSSSWGNGHATTYRSLIKGLSREGHRVDFLERDVSWYAENRDLNSSPYCSLHFYKTTEELRSNYTDLIQKADLVIAGSYLQDGVPISKWVNGLAQGVTAFYDIDTPVTLSKLEQQDYEYIHPDLIPEFDLYLSFSGGKILRKLENVYQAKSAKPLFCSVDPELYHPESTGKQWQLGYLGTYSDDRQPALDKLLLKTARKQSGDRFVVAGPQYPADISWPDNVQRIEHLPPAKHRNFYNRQRFTLNITRAAMVDAGLSPSVRLFEAAACGVPVISDYWEGLETIFEPNKEILIADSTEDVQRYLKEYSKRESWEMGRRARQKVLEHHSSRERARQLTGYIRELKVAV